MPTIKLSSLPIEIQKQILNQNKQAAVNKNWGKDWVSPQSLVLHKNFKMVPFHELSVEQQSVARRWWPANSPGAKYDFIHEHYYYPVKINGEIPKGRGATRVLAIPYEKIKDDEYMKSLGYEIKHNWNQSKIGLNFESIESIERKYRRDAKKVIKSFHYQDEIDVDDDARVSISSDPDAGGAFVQCWLWVPKPDDLEPDYEG